MLFVVDVSDILTTVGAAVLFAACPYVQQLTTSEQTLNCSLTRLRELCTNSSQNIERYNLWIGRLCINSSQSTERCSLWIGHYASTHPGIQRYNMWIGLAGESYASTHHEMQRDIVWFICEHNHYIVFIIIIRICKAPYFSDNVNLAIVAIVAIINRSSIINQFHHRSALSYPLHSDSACCFLHVITL